MEKFIIETNNQGKAALHFDKSKDALVWEQFNGNGGLEHRTSINSGDIITLLNWYTFQKEEGNVDLLF